MAMQPNKPTLYSRIEAYITEGIESGAFQDGARLPTESELCQMFSASKMTVNRALTNLSQKGLIKRVPGKGSFVRRMVVEKKIPEMISFTEELNRAGVMCSTELLYYSVAPAAQFTVIAEKIGAAPDELIHYFIRLRLGDGQPFAVSYNYVLVSQVPVIDVACLKTSFYRYLEDMVKLTLGYNDTVIKVVRPNDLTRDKLRLNKSDMVVCSAHVSYLSNGSPFEYTETFYLANKYEFTYRCYRKTDKLSPVIIQ
jgi:DNA-binding GntR family transcriptional regulator